MYFKTKIEEADTKEIVNSEFINWDYYKNSTIFVTGATGLIGSQIVRSILFANETLNTKIKIIALVRNKDKVRNIFGKIKTNNLKFIVQDITNPIKHRDNVDFIIHTANGTSSREFTEKPVETINSIVIGTKNVLNFANNKNIKGLVYLSSMEVYGETDFNRTEPLKENEYGYIDLLNTRNSYPIGKRLAENMCYSYAQEFNLPIKIARLSQTIGSGVDYNDNRMFAEFARNITEKKDIVLQSSGETTRSYICLTDAIVGIFKILEKGEVADCYNLSNTSTQCSVKEIAEMLVNKHTDSKLRMELQENKYYLGKVKLVLDTTKLQALGWKPKVDLNEMFDRLIQNFEIIRENNK